MDQAASKSAMLFEGSGSPTMRSPQPEKADTKRASAYGKKRFIAKTFLQVVGDRDSEKVGAGEEIVPGAQSGDFQPVSKSSRHRGCDTIPHAKFCGSPESIPYAEKFDEGLVTLCRIDHPSAK